MAAGTKCQDLRLLRYPCALHGACSQMLSSVPRRDPCQHVATEDKGYICLRAQSFCVSVSLFFSVLFARCLCLSPLGPMCPVFILSWSLTKVTIQGSLLILKYLDSAICRLLHIHQATHLRTHFGFHDLLKIQHNQMLLQIMRVFMSHKNLDN